MLTVSACAHLPFLLGPQVPAANPAIASSAGPGETNPTGSPKTNPTGSPEPILSGKVVDEITNTEAKTASNPAPTPTIVHSTNPGPIFIKPFAIEVKVVPERLDLGVNPPQGATPYAPSTAQLKAEVLMSNGLRSSEVTWTSSDPSVAEVTPDGKVRALSKFSFAFVWATSLDQLASASCHIRVLPFSGVGVEIN